MSLLEHSLAELVCERPGATAIFHRHRLDFCCGGQQSLASALAARGLAPEAIVAELEALPFGHDHDVDWRQADNATLIDHLLTRFHAVHREQLPELIRLARRVEQVHRERPGCPRGLASQLMLMAEELEAHMQKEEQILFPLFLRGELALASGPVRVMEAEHEQHGGSLELISELTDDITPPEGACVTWRALYHGLRQLREDLMLHIHLENHLLFPRAQA